MPIAGGRDTQGAALPFLWACHQGGFRVHCNKRVAGTAAWTFSIPRDGCWIETHAPPEAVVAYEEGDLIAMFGRTGLFLAEPVRYGCWSETKHQDQDFLVLRKGS
jgi:hypothetical protein